MARFGGDQTVVVSVCPRCGSTIGMPDAAFAKGCAGIFVWMESPTSGFDHSEVDALTAALQPVPAMLVAQQIISDDAQPKLDLVREDWQRLNDRYVRYLVLPEHAHNLFPGAVRFMAWHCFAYRPPSGIRDELTEAPLPVLTGERLKGMVARYAAGRKALAQRRPRPAGDAATLATQQKTLSRLGLPR